MKTSNEAGRSLARGDADFDQEVLGTSFGAGDPGRRPDILVQANSIEDVVSAVRTAKERGLQVSCCSGGHAWSQNHIRSGGVLVDLARLDDVTVDTSAGVATVGPGCVGGKLDAELAKHGLFFPVPHAYTVGLGGFLLQGGFGWNSQVIGLGCENVIGVDVVLADGSVVHANKTENADIFWAARGSGPGFFAIVVRFHLRLSARPAFSGMKVQIFRMRHMEEVVAWAHSIGRQLSPKVEFSMTFSRKALGIFTHGVEIVTPVLADSKAEARELVSFINDGPLRRKASLTLPLLPLSIPRIMKTAEKVMFLPNTRWHTDNMWFDGDIDALLPALRRVADTQPAKPSHLYWMNWNPLNRHREDMAFSLEAQTYIALYGAFRGKRDPDVDEGWATAHAKAMADLSVGIQLADENLARREAPFMAPDNLARLERLRSKYDPERRFHSFGLS